MCIYRLFPFDLVVIFFAIPLFAVVRFAVLFTLRFFGAASSAFSFAFLFLVIAARFGLCHANFTDDNYVLYWKS